MVRAILTLHFYDDGNFFLGQKLLWVEVTSTGALGTLIDLLARACRPKDFYGTERFPRESEAFALIKFALEMAYENPYHHPSDTHIKKMATSVRVMQVQEGWPLPVPRTRM